MKSKKRALLLVNTGARRGTESLDAIVGRLHAGKIDVTIEPFSAFPEIARDIVRLRENHDLIILCGGDGTIASGAMAVMESGLPLGIIPMGTANDLARTLDIPLVTLHAGFMPEEPTDPERPKLMARLRTIIDIYAEQGVRVGFETGQETAHTLIGLLSELDRKTAGVNFDPANMILYDKGDPIEALRQLSLHVFQVHIKDANRATTPGAWGDQTPIGAGQVNWTAFFEVLAERRLTCDLMIEREAGSKRIPEVRQAAALIAEHLARR